MIFKLAFISGAASGLGEELATELALKKIPLLLTSKDEKKLLALQKKLEPLTSVEVFPSDLSVRQDLEKLLIKIQEKKPDLIINNAGIGLYGEILDFPLLQQMQILEVNIHALVALSIEAARMLKQEKRQGIIMNISSAASFFIYPGFALYAASKRFVKEFSLSFDEELSVYGIRVLTCLPGRFSSNFRFHAAQKEPTPISGLDTIPLKKVAQKVLRQIEKRKNCQVIDFRYQILCSLARCIPRRWLANCLKIQTKDLL
jgi:short-subunit dehydrogenase